jgi:hypothetical protein
MPAVPRWYAEEGASISITALELTAKTLPRFARGSAPALAFSCGGGSHR